MSLFSFIKKLFKKEETPVKVNDQITDAVTQLLTEFETEQPEKPKKMSAKPKKVKTTKKVELTEEAKEKIVKELKNKGVYNGTPKKKKQK